MRTITTSLELINYVKFLQVETERKMPELRKFHNLDASEFLALFPDESVDVIFTDEDYGVPEMDYTRSGKNISTKFGWSDVEDQSYKNLLEKYTFKDVGYDTKPRLPLHLRNPWIFEVARVLKPDGLLINFAIGEFVGSFSDVCTVSGLQYKASCPWIKTNPPPSFRKSNFRSGVEYMVWASKGRNTHERINFIDHSEMKNYFLDNVCPHCNLTHPVTFSSNHDIPGWWYMLSGLNQDRLTDHPTEKPAWLIGKLMKIFIRENDLVVDPCSGSGKIPYMLHINGHKNWIANDLDPKWVEVGTNLIEKSQVGVF